MFLTASAGTAQAAEMTRFPTGVSLGGLAQPESLAVDQDSGDVYVVDPSSLEVKRFNSELQPAPFSKLGTSVIDGMGEGSCVGVSDSCDEIPQGGFSFDSPGAAQVAIDNSGNPLTDGDIYITDSFNHVVDIFAPSGEYLGQLSASGSGGLAFGEPCGVTVDPSGAVYVGDYSTASVHRFVPTANPASDADFVSDVFTPTPCAVAAGASSTAGALFVNQWHGPVLKFDEAGNEEYTVAPDSASSVAVDPGSGYLLATADGEGTVSEYDASGTSSATRVGTFGSDQISRAAGVAVNGAEEKAYVSDSFKGEVIQFGPLQAPIPLSMPVVTLAPNTPSTSSSVLLNGYVSGGSETTYYFEYGTQDCSVSSCASAPLGQDGELKGPIEPERVSQEVTGLKPATTYHYRLVATNEIGTEETTDATFRTPDGFAASKCPNAGVRQEQGSGYLPECRGYELVTAIPASQRNGANVVLSTQRTQAAADGEAFEFSSFTGTAGVQSLPGSADYMAVRDAAGGWSVQGVMPPQPSPSLFDLIEARQPRYLGDLSSDLSKGVFFALGPVGEEGENVRDVTNLYLRDDLLDSGNGSYRLLTDSVSPQTSEGSEAPAPSFAGASADFSHVYFQSERALTADAEGLDEEGPKLYVWVNGLVHLVGVLPPSEGGGPTLARAGRGSESHFTSRAISRDGSRAVFTTPEFGEMEGQGNLYLRDDHRTENPSDDTTVKINASEKTNGAGSGGSDSSGPRPASFWDATDDLGQVFFTSEEALTDDTPEDTPNSPKLYRFDLNAPSGERLTLLSIDSNPAGGTDDEADGVIATSGDGSYVYFVSSNQLLAGAATGSTPRIFVWHAGAIQEVGAINAGKETTRILGDEGIKQPKWSRVTADGKHLTFVSEGTKELPGNDQGTACPELTTSQCQKVYAFTVDPSGGPGSLQCVSCDPTGIAASADADFNLIAPNLAALGSHLNHALSSDGRLIFFTTAQKLSPEDANDGPDAYAYDTATATVRLLSGGRIGTKSYFLDASGDGRSAFFATEDRLLAGDGNANVDVYVARVDGGVSEAPAPIPCASQEACRPATSSAPDPLVPESSKFQSAAPQSPAPAHPRHKHKKHRAHGKKKHGKAGSGAGHRRGSGGHA
jgi:DNA-binding beta-propeller fold protein YncE